MSERMEIADRLAELRARWFRLTRELGALPDVREQDRLIRELESIESEMRTAVVDAAKIMRSDENEIALLRARVALFPVLLDATRLFDDVMKCRREGPWRDVAAFRARWAIPVDETVESFCERTIAAAMAKVQGSSA